MCVVDVTDFMVDWLDFESRDNLRDTVGVGSGDSRVFEGLHPVSSLKRRPYTHRLLTCTYLDLFGHTICANMRKSALIVLPQDFTFASFVEPCVWAYHRS